jgi:hypothetical protein
MRSPYVGLVQKTGSIKPSIWTFILIWEPTGTIQLTASECNAPAQLSIPE